ncbi:MAG TPA: methyltransferase domain-containing protein [Candidatus Acidoferrales bacterium]|nr:methyltransferase domain-containing protein [Candidatus Acidoferrales bacterium]
MEDLEAGPSPLLTEFARQWPPGTALDLACGAGRNALWLAQRGWQVTAVDGAAAAIEILRSRAIQLGLPVDARVANLEIGEYRIEPSSWDLIVIAYYLQRDLFEAAREGLVPGGILLAIVHLAEPGEEPTAHRLRPGELDNDFPGWEILHRYEGKPNDPAHRRLVAEIVARRPVIGAR